eukprot:gene3978-14057_t
MRSSAPCHTRFCSRPTPSVVHARSRALVGRPCRHIAAAVVSEDGTIPLPFLPLSIPEKLYTVIQAGVLTFSLGVADAGYSGDWSRIGAISKDNELLLQTVFLWIVVSHSVIVVLQSVVGAMAASTASTNIDVVIAFIDTKFNLEDAAVVAAVDISPWHWIIHHRRHVVVLALGPFGGYDSGIFKVELGVDKGKSGLIFGSPAAFR